MSNLPPGAREEARLEARLFWPRTWIYVGFSSAIPEAGDILPFTIAEAGIHLERLPNGGLAARLNRAQQGGCVTIPQQCHGGVQLRCPQVACAFSRDQLPKIGVATPGRAGLLRQFLGNRPDRLPMLAIDERGGFIRINLAPEPAEQSDTPLPLPPTGVFWWHEIAAPWRLIVHHLHHVTVRTGGAAILHFPNLLRLRWTAGEAAIILQPLGPTVTRCRIALAGVSGGCSASRASLEDILALAALRATADDGASASDEPGRALAYGVAQIVALSSSAGRRSPPAGRLNPHFGAIGG